MTAFKDTTLGQVVTLQRGFDITKKEQTPGNVPIVSSSGVASYHNVFKVKGPGVIIGRKGTLGTSHFIKQDYWPHDTTLWVKDFKGNDPRFISYYLKSLKLEKFDTGSSNPTLNRNHLHKIKIVFPEPKIQKKVAAIVSGYDDAIEINKQRISLLKNMAEEIYREWFVRFRFPGYQEAEFEKGVPNNFDLKRFSTFCKFIKGKNPDEIKIVIADGDLYYINMDTLRGRLNSFATKKKNSVICDKGDILMLMDGSRSGLTFRANVNGIVGSTLSMIRVKKSLKNIVFEYLKAMTTEIVFNNTGSAIPHANKDYINRMLIAIPNDEIIINQFNSIYEPIYKNIELLQAEIENLKETKNALLPRLISGKLSVEDLDIQFPPSMLEKNEIN